MSTENKHTGTAASQPSTPKRDLEKAGALIAAEWERLDRAERRQSEEPRS